MNLNKIVSALDWLVALVALVYGVVMVAVEWPDPSVWSWTALAVGVVGVPLALINPMRRMQTWMLRRMVKR